MYNRTDEKHKPHYPNARGIRRACSKELYRTVKRLKTRITPEQMKQAEEKYFKKVALNLPVIVGMQSNRKAQADWWEEHVSAEIAELWQVDPALLNRAFRDAYGG
jgi:predicted RNase H-like nuclease